MRPGIDRVGRSAGAGIGNPQRFPIPDERHKGGIVVPSAKKAERGNDSSLGGPGGLPLWPASRWRSDRRYELSLDRAYAGLVHFRFVFFILIGFQREELDLGFGIILKRILSFII